MIESLRPLDHRQVLLRFSVKRREDLLGRVVPFFEEHPLRTAKRLDFERFASVLRSMQSGAHLSERGLRWIARETEQMNRRGRSRYLESSEAIRQPSRSDHRVEDMVLASWRHGGSLERNSLSGKFRPARMA